MSKVENIPPPAKELQPQRKRAHDESQKELEENELSGYQKLCKIGEGTYGVVFKARQKHTNRLVALKRIRLNLTHGVPTTTIREVAILKEMNHTNVIRLIDMVQKDAIIYIVSEFAEVDLRKYMDMTRRKGLDYSHIKSFLHQLLLGLDYCHSHRILHRDLKPQNLLIDKNGKLTIADLGLSRAFGVPLRTYTHNVITLWYRAPEILLGSTYYSTAVDMWSVGCIFGEMLTLEPIFPGDSQIDELFRIFRMMGTPNEEMWPGISTLPDYHQTFPPWKPVKFQDAFKNIGEPIEPNPLAFHLLKHMLMYDPSKRINAKRALEHPFFYDDLSILDLS